MDLPVMPPVAPMLAKLVRDIPDTGHIEPKWDGFRAVVFRDGDEVVIGSRSSRPLTRYFPEVVEAVLAATPPRCVLDGEIIAVTQDRLDFPALQQRIHPAASRIRALAQSSPASFVAFDILALGEQDLQPWPFARRRAALADLLPTAAAVAGPDGAAGSSQLLLTPATADLAVAREWFDSFEQAGLDGVVAKPLDGTYQPGKRSMFKIKHERTADCVVAGFRWHSDGPVVGSLLLGLYDAQGRLHHVGVTASFSAARRAELVTELAGYRDVDPAEHPWLAAGPAADGGGAPGGSPSPGENAGQRVPGEVNRWNAGKDLSFVPLRPELVVEVGYDHLEGDRFRHTTTWRRWRPDRAATSCTYEQLERPGERGLSQLLGGLGH